MRLVHWGKLKIHSAVFWFMALRDVVHGYRDSIGNQRLQLRDKSEIVTTVTSPNYLSFEINIKVIQRCVKKLVNEQCDASNPIVTSMYQWYMDSRWYTSDPPHTPIGMFIHMSHCTIKAFTVAQKKLMSSIYIARI